MELQSSKSKKIRLYTAFVICLFCSISFKAAAVEKGNNTTDIVPQAVRALPVADSLSDNIKPLNVKLSTYDPKRDSAPTPERKEVIIAPKFEFFGDSLWHCPLIDYKSDYFVVGAFYAPDPIVYDDKNAYSALAFTNEDIDEIKKQTPGNIEKLIEKGWFLRFPLDQISIQMNDDNPIIYNVEKKYLVDPPIYPVTVKDGKNSEYTPVGRYYRKPDAYLLVLIKSDYLRSIHEDRIGLKLKLKSNGAYYPVVFPLLLKSDKTSENE